jgi:tRNA U34 2-thiouridine synthase MnmA/TrmU
MNGAARPAAGRALCLLSGGLDSRLAICVLREQGCHVEALCFDSPFFRPAAARAAAAALGVALHVIDFTDDIVGLVESPPHGYGGGMNPCIDCHARMVRRAAETMRAAGLDFVATGEVLNQRPMSQNRRSLAIVARESGIPDLLLRPLSALLLDPTAPERDGRVDRARLLDLQGRTRKPQMALAQRYGLLDYPTPAGGCLLTEPGFCRRLKDLVEHEGLADRRLIRLLRFGRHFRLPGGALCIVGRNASDNAALEAGRAPGDALFYPADVPGPTVWLDGRASAADRDAAAGLCAAYSDRPAGDGPIAVRCERAGVGRDAPVAALPRQGFAAWMR